MDHYVNVLFETSFERKAGVYGDICGGRKGFNINKVMSSNIKMCNTHFGLKCDVPLLLLVLVYKGLLFI